ncbi:MAG: hypothetical protein J5I62_11865 [Flavobacteriales bacterium]|nr:hypothetical protein [Flavobacteriales bacterium]MEB2342863.1 hypothetical protein [Flavobacteriia bacterium]
MRTMKLFAAALLIGVATTASAQCGGHADKACADMAKAKADLLTKELALDEGQAAQVQALLAKNEENVAGMRGHCEVMDAKAKKADESTYASINELLDEKQQKRFEELRGSGKLEACGKEGGKGCCAGKKGEAKMKGNDLRKEMKVKEESRRDAGSGLKSARSAN